MIDEHDEEIIENICAQLSEHFSHWAVVVMDDSGEPFYNYTNWRVGRMLFKDAIEDMHEEISIPDPIMYEEEWDEEDEDEV